MIDHYLPTRIKRGFIELKIWKKRKFTRKLNVSPVVTPSTIDEYVEVGNCSSRIGKVKQPLDKTNMKRERAEMNEAIIEIV